MNFTGRLCSKVHRLFREGIDTLPRFSRRLCDNRIEEGVTRDLRQGAETYAGYLELDRLLDAQHPLSDPHHDEMLFIIQHQTSELWMKLMLHELDAARALRRSTTSSPRFKIFARVEHIQTRCSSSSGRVLETLTPTEYVEFRDALGHASGFQSYQYRVDRVPARQQGRADAAVFRQPRLARIDSTRGLRRPACTTSSCGYLARRGYSVP